MKIRTNKQPRLLLDWSQLTPQEQKALDYLDTDGRREFARLFRYRGWVYDLGEFTAVHTALVEPMGGDLKGWDGYQSDSFFSGIVIKYCGEDHDRVIVGRYST